MQIQQTTGERCDMNMWHEHVTWTQRRPESPAVTLIRHANNYNEHNLHEKYILILIFT